MVTPAEALGSRGLNGKRRLQTRRRLENGGSPVVRQEVTSRISGASPQAIRPPCRARIAVSRPEPGPLDRTLWRHAP